MKGQVYLVELSPTTGSEQAGKRPVVIVQRNELNAVTNTIVAVPFTTNLKRTKLPTSVFVPKGEGGLREDSVALCNQIRTFDKSRLEKYLGTIGDDYLERIELALCYTFDIP